MLYRFLKVNRLPSPTSSQTGDVSHTVHFARTSRSLPGYRGFPDKVLPNPIKCLDRLGDWLRFEVATAAALVPAVPGRLGSEDQGVAAHRRGIARRDRGYRWTGWLGCWGGVACSRSVGALPYGQCRQPLPQQ